MFRVFLLALTILGVMGCKDASPTQKFEPYSAPGRREIVTIDGVFTDWKLATEAKVAFSRPEGSEVIFAYTPDTIRVFPKFVVLSHQGEMPVHVLASCQGYEDIRVPIRSRGKDLLVRGIVTTYRGKVQVEALEIVLNPP